MRPSDKIYIALWKRGPSPGLEVVQEIEIYRDEDGKAENLTGDDLRITIQQMMLRDPGPGEGGFIFTRDELLHGLAEGVWWGIDHKRGEENEKNLSRS